MERFCGILKRALKSKRHPYANLSKRILHVTWLNQIRYRYNVEEELQLPSPEYRYRKSDGALTKSERMYDDCAYLYTYHLASAYFSSRS